MGLVSVIQQTPSLGKIVLQTLRGGKPTRELQIILSILISILHPDSFLLVFFELFSGRRIYSKMKRVSLLIFDNRYLKINANKVD